MRRPLLALAPLACQSDASPRVEARVVSDSGGPVSVLPTEAAIDTVDDGLERPAHAPNGEPLADRVGSNGLGTAPGQAEAAKRSSSAARMAWTRRSASNTS